MKIKVLDGFLTNFSVQLILGIVVLEKELDQMVGYNDMEVKQGYYHNFQSFDNYFYGDHVWIAFMVRN